ncbi:N-acetylglucosaminidase [Macrococcus lamae]|uniref:Autolysin n=1 Tax=Macrococcus lamae TaxID=198484 RepID=A0A4R6BT22_9STAP|nr:N-acetylglucosaminidase [Macrococcus lamae]TDM07514.1 autolysin [Macrococcus lamae]
MTQKQLAKRQLEIRNKWIMTGIVVLIGTGIYLMVRMSIAAYEERMEDRRVTVDYTYAEAKKRQQKAAPAVSDGVSWSPADGRDIDRFMQPDKFYFHSEQRYQFLNLKMSQKIDAQTLDELLDGQGILDGLGKAFAQASRKEDVNEVYLISHAMLETGKGRSELARGVTLNNEGKRDTDGTRYYNFFGIGAYDNNPVMSGARHAQQQGWDTPEKAVRGGAEFIHREYLARDNQYTLYSMRFNPADPGRHQYATDVMWAHHNARQMADYYKQLGREGRFFTRHYYKR